MMVLYISNRGEVACGENRHGGQYLTSMIKSDPGQDVYVTSLDHWVIANDALVTEYGLECEGCRMEKS